jgi:DnaK suppressor protein
MEQEYLKRTRFDEDTLTYFKERLLEKRKEAKEQIEILENRIQNLMDADDADYSSFTHHIGDVGSEQEEADMIYQLLERTKKYVNEINDALERIENRTYGICQATGNPIEKGRLDAVPHTRYSLEAKGKNLDKNA